MCEKRDREVVGVVMEVMESFWFWLVFVWYKMFKYFSSEEDMENVGFI